MPASPNTATTTAGGSSSSTSSSSGIDSTTDDDLQLQSSLKRVRISTSPGELRLERDLQQLGWWASSSSSHRHFSLTKDVVLERSHALGIVVHVAARTVRVQLDIPRMYPHATPVIVRVEETPTTTTTTTAYSAPALTLLAKRIPWSPIMTLGDFLQRLLAELADSTTMEVDKDIDYIDYVDYIDLHTPTKHHQNTILSVLAPNRFDVGYERSPSTTTHNRMTTRTTNNDNNNNTMMSTTKTTTFSAHSTPIKTTTPTTTTPWTTVQPMDC